MLGAYSPDDGLVSQSIHLYTLWVGRTSPSDIKQCVSPSQSILITIFLLFIPISDKASSIFTPIAVITATDPYRSRDPCILSILP